MGNTKRVIWRPIAKFGFRKRVYIVTGYEALEDSGYFIIGQ